MTALPQFWNGLPLFVDGLPAMNQRCCCDVGTFGVCTDFFTNLQNVTVMYHTMSGLFNNVACSACESLNTTYALTWENTGSPLTACCWSYLAPHCVIGDGGAVSSRLCIREDFFLGYVCELIFKISRTDADGDGTPPASASGTISATYQTTISTSTTILPNPLVLLRVAIDNDPTNGPCVWIPDAPLSVTVSF